MNDPCNLSPEQQKQFVPALIPAPCPASYPGQLTTIASDWHDIDAVVDHIRSSRKVEKVSLVAWSLGGPRAGGYAAQHPHKVHRLVLLAPAYNRDARAEPPTLPNPGTVFNTQSRAEFDANWDRQIGCPHQVDPAVREVVWKEMLASDPVGATWGAGVRRAPSTTTWGWNAEMIGKTRTPTLMVAAALDRQVPPDRVKAAFADLGAPDKVLLDLGCASHNAMWEGNHLLLFSASLEWLTKGTVEGKREGVVSMGYASAQVTGPVAPAITAAQIHASQALAPKYDRSTAMEQARQATFKNRPVGAIVQKSFDGFANYLMIAAQMMPESGYGFRPTPDVRTFGEQINHATGANYAFCNQPGAPPGFERRSAPSLQGVTTKSAIVKALEESVAYCSSVIAAASEEWLLESVPNLGGAGSGRITGARAYALIYAGIHGAEDYGTITTYLRMQGLVPPSTALVAK
jgi:pimeloyl-ACP methyl ester carboxylesterase